MTATVAVKTFPVVEIFGPVVQGEGILAGLPTHFIRFGGCDYRCSWCDSKYAVEPAEVRKAEKLAASEIVGRVQALGTGPRWVTLSGGNPALLQLGDVVAGLQGFGFKVAVETQGSRWRDWLANIDCLTVSPKPPSSGEPIAKVERQIAAFRALCDTWRFAKREQDCLKIVVFDEDDLDWARAVINEFPGWPAFLSCGTDSISQWDSDVVEGESHIHALRRISERYAWLCDRVAGDSLLCDTKVLPQLHVVAFGHARGV